MTPKTVHFGEVDEVAKIRMDALKAAYCEESTCMRLIAPKMGKIGDGDIKNPLIYGGETT